MQLARAVELPWRPIAVQRETGKDAKTLLSGRDGALDNYTLVLVRESKVATTPRHKHNFDQLRMTISGRTNYGPDCWIEPGEIAYFPEGVPYGPEVCEGNRVGLTFQFGGATGNGFVSRRQVTAAREQLLQSGRFERGVYHRSSPAPGQSRTQDAFEAIWERVNQRPVVYPTPRYDAPVLMRAPGFPWLADPVQAGVSAKLLGVFTERRLEISMLGIQPGASAMIGPRPGLILCCVLRGAGEVNGESVAGHAAFEIAAGTVVEAKAREEIELLVVGLPIF